VFHVSLVKPYTSNGRVQPPPLPLIVDNEEWYHIERIIDHKQVNKGRKTTVHYLVKWLGYGSEHNTWEPVDNITDVALKAYEAYLPSKHSSDCAATQFCKLSLRQLKP